MITNLTEFYKSHPVVRELGAQLSKNLPNCWFVKGLSGSSRSLFVLALANQRPGLQVHIETDHEQAAYLYTDLASLEGDANVLFYPGSYRRSVKYQQPDTSNQLLRTEVQSYLSGLEGQAAGNNTYIVTYPEALLEKVITPQKLKSNTLALQAGEKVSVDFILEVLYTYHFTKVDFVSEPGEFALRGSIIDVFSFSNDRPYRIDFFGNEIESIRSFDVDSQLSYQKHEKVNIVPNVQSIALEEAATHFFDFLPSSSILWCQNFTFLQETLVALYNNTCIEHKDKVLFDAQKLETIVEGFQKIDFRQEPAQNNVFSFNTAPQPAVNKQFELLVETLQQYSQQQYEIFIVSEQEKQFDRLQHIFESLGAGIQFKPVYKNLHQGFIDNDLKICVFTDHQIFDRYHKFRINRGFNKKESINLKELTNLKPGDYVVHIDHGIGKFGGLDTINVNGKKQEAIRLIYRDNDILYVSIHSLHRISKYKGADGEPPKIYKLGSGAWQKLKNNTKNKVKDIAKDLIALYAKRIAQQGFAFSGDNYLQEELEASFLFEDTPDQAKATNAVKTAMEAEHPMDMLVCGDVGFGKTEVAIRAAFKAVNDNKQVAILVPTTILALQHYKTFKDRLKDFPCRVAHLSRLRKPKEQKEVIDGIEQGKIDIVIGTHRLVGKDISFKDLGLLIIDEEQKFGVAVKEKLKALKLNVDTLTLTATPIPRTLQFSLMGARDLSIINTPPPNRHPIITELHTLNDEIIRDGIEYETARGGQVFFIHNRVQNIAEIDALV
ncbi:MAG: DEAD/DEAH box helicase, partial [Bacteroidales bacterium]|nr:DEAD/DEAH box helicase [Bacteroidales bacterium]